MSNYSKRQLYDIIMNSVSSEVKKYINENYKLLSDINGDFADIQLNTKTINTNINANLASAKHMNHKFVDLGLPSGTLWATLNIGAFGIYDPGYYYAWGELETKSYYDLDNYEFLKEGNIQKYNGEDNIKILEPADDVAHYLWGGNWKMPTKEQIDELLTLEREFIPESSGRRAVFCITGLNGNKLYLPLSNDFCYSVDSLKTFACFWTSEAAANEELLAHYLHLHKDTPNIAKTTHYQWKSTGCPVRPVVNINEI